jgi:hypothetical protein
VAPAVPHACHSKKSKIQALNLASAILEGLMPVTTEPEPEDTDDESPSRSALRIIDTLSTHLPPAQVFPALRVLLQQYFASPDPNFRRGAMLALGVVVEGCSEFMTPHFDQVWPYVESGLRDPDAGVRKATCQTVGCLSEWIDDKIAEQHETLIPVRTLLAPARFAPR